MTRRVVEGLLIPTLLAAGWFAMKDLAPRGDESAHLLQILAIHEGDWAPRLTMIPGYHAVMAKAWSFFELPVSMASGRILTVALTLPGLLAFFLVARRLDRETATLRTASFLALPALFPYTFLVYTDTFALSLLLLAFAAHVDRRPLLSGIFGLASLLVRQSFAPWIALLLFMPDADERDRPYHRDVLRRWPHALVLAVFTAFVLTNGGVALGGKHRHPFPQVHCENIAVTVALVLALTLPLWLAGGRILSDGRRRLPWALLGAAAVTGSWFAFYEVDHPFNTLDDYVHNRVAAWLSTDQPRAAVVGAGLVVFLGAFACGFMPTVRRRFSLVLPFWAASLVPAWLIEHRYALPGLALWFLTRRSASRRTEVLLLLWFIVLDVALVVGIRSQAFFP